MENPLHESLYFTVSKLHRNIDRIANDSFTSVGLAPNYSLLLLLLDEWKELSPGKISVYLDIKPSTTTRFLDKLQKNNYIKRRFSGKFSYVTLTSKGEHKIPEIKGAFESMEVLLSKLATQKLKEREIKLAIELADRIKEPINK